MPALLNRKGLLRRPFIFQISVYRSVQIGATGQKHHCHCEERSDAPQGGLSCPLGAIHLLAISWKNVGYRKIFKVWHILADTSLLGAIIVFGLYREIATGLKALAMTVVFFARFRRFEQSDKLKFKTYKTGVSGWTRPHFLLIGLLKLGSLTLLLGAEEPLQFGNQDHADQRRSEAAVI